MRGYHRDGDGSGLIVFAGLLIIALIAGGCAPSRFLMKNDQGSTEAVCYQASGGLFGGPALQCLPAHEEKPAAVEVVDGGVK